GHHLQSLVGGSAVVQVHSFDQLTGLNEVEVSVHERGGHQSTVEINFSGSGGRCSGCRVVADKGNAVVDHDQRGRGHLFRRVDPPVAEDRNGGLALGRGSSGRPFLQLDLRTVIERHGQGGGGVGGYLAVRSNPGKQRLQLRHVLHLNLQQVAGVTGD